MMYYHMKLQLHTALGVSCQHLRTCVLARVRSCVRAYVRGCVRACVSACVSACVCVGIFPKIE